AHYRGVDADAVGAIARASNKALDLRELFEAFVLSCVADGAPANSRNSGGSIAIRRTLAFGAVAKPYNAVPIQKGEHLLNRCRLEPRALGEIAALVLP